MVPEANKQGLPDIPDNQALSQTVLLHFNADTGTFVRSYQFRLPGTWKDGKAEVLRMDLGKIKPILAFGNTMGDFEMLEYVERPGMHSGGLSLVLNHDDAKRECFYEDKELLEKARANRWVIVSMKEDFEVLFKPEVVRQKAGCSNKKK